jgi:GNAT superfamily N-acetyltransferase
MICFRKAADSDKGILKEIARRVIEHNYTPFLGAEAITAFIESGDSDREIEEGMENCVLAMLEDRIIGFAVTKDSLLHLMMVDVPYQRSGYGSALLKHIEDTLFDSYDHLRLQTFRDNINAVLFYKKHGWSRVEPLSDADTGIAMLQFEKKRGYK